MIFASFETGMALKFDEVYRRQLLAEPLLAGEVALVVREEKLNGLEMLRPIQINRDGFEVNEWLISFDRKPKQSVVVVPNQNRPDELAGFGIQSLGRP